MRVHLLLGLAVSVCASTAAEEGPKAEAIPSFGLGKLDFGQRRSADAEEDLPIAREPDKTAVEAPPEPEATHMDTTGDPLAIAPRTPAFWDIIAPVAEKAFVEEYWARRPLHIARNKENSFKQEQETKKRIIAKVPLPKEVGDLLKVSSVDHILRGSPTLQMYMRSAGTAVGRPGAVPVAALLDGVSAQSLRQGGFSSVHSAYLAGHTVLVENAEMWFEPYAHLCRALGAYFDYNFRVELYLTPAGRPVLKPRSSSSDFFVIQLAGTSTWEMAPSPIANIFAQHELAPGSEQAREQLAQRERVFETTLAQGETLFIPRGWVLSAGTGDDKASRLLMLAADSQHFSHATFIKALIQTLSKTVAAEGGAEDGATSIFTRTQAAALTGDLIVDFIDKTIEEQDQDWLRQALPFGISSGDGMGSLVGAIRASLIQLRSTIQERAPSCDHGTNGCAGAVDTLLGNMAMLQGLTKFVWESVFAKQLKSRMDMLRAQSVQQRVWKDEERALMRCVTLDNETTTGLHSREQTRLSMSSVLRLLSDATRDLSPMAAAFVGKHTEGAEFTVQSIPSAEDDDVYRASLAAHLLDAAVVELVPMGCEEPVGHEEL